MRAATRAPITGELEPFLRQVLADLTGDPPEAFDLDEPFRRSAGIDSLVILQVVAAVEEAFGVRIPDDAFEGLRTLGDLLRTARVAGARGEEARGPQGLARHHHPGTPTDR